MLCSWLALNSTDGAKLRPYLLYARSKEFGNLLNPLSYISMARMKKRIALTGSPARHFSPPSSCSTPAMTVSLAMLPRVIQTYQLKIHQQFGVPILKVSIPVLHYGSFVTYRLLASLFLPSFPTRSFLCQSLWLRHWCGCDQKTFQWDRSPQLLSV